MSSWPRIYTIFLSGEFAFRIAINLHLSSCSWVEFGLTGINSRINWRDLLPGTIFPDFCVAITRFDKTLFAFFFLHRCATTCPSQIPAVRLNKSMTSQMLSSQTLHNRLRTGNNGSAGITICCVVVWPATVNLSTHIGQIHKSNINTAMYDSDKLCSQLLRIQPLVNYLLYRCAIPITGIMPFEQSSPKGYVFDWFVESSGSGYRFDGWFVYFIKPGYL